MWPRYVPDWCSPGTRAHRALDRAPLTQIGERHHEKESAPAAVEVKQVIVQKRPQEQVRCPQPPAKLARVFLPLVGRVCDYPASHKLLRPFGLHALENRGDACESIVQRGRVLRSRSGLALQLAGDENGRLQRVRNLIERVAKAVWIVCWHG
jgi:hypothetical protein